MVSQAPRLWSRYQDFDRINQREEMMEVQSAVFIPAKAPNYMDEEGPNSEAKHYYNTLKNYTYLIKTAQYSAFNITLTFKQTRQGSCCLHFLEVCKCQYSCDVKITDILSLKRGR